MNSVKETRTLCSSYLIFHNLLFQRYYFQWRELDTANGFSHTCSTGLQGVHSSVTVDGMEQNNPQEFIMKHQWADTSVTRMLNPGCF